MKHLKIKQLKTYQNALFSNMTLVMAGILIAKSIKQLSQKKLRMTKIFLPALC